MIDLVIIILAVMVLLFLLSCCFMVARLLDEEISMYGYEGKENWEREQLSDKLSRSSTVERHVIVINRGAEITAYYVDSFGFQELPEFVQQRMNMLEHNSVRAYPPVYKGTLEQAMGERDVDAYLDSRKLNLDCKKAIEEAIRENFDGLHLKQDAAKEVVERFGEERMNFVMANTIRELSNDGRFSRRNKDWAEHIEVP